MGSNPTSAAPFSFSVKKELFRLVLLLDSADPPRSSVVEINSTGCHKKDIDALSRTNRVYLQFP